MSQDKPNAIYPKPVNATPQFMPPLIPDNSIRGASFDQFLQNRGIRFIHKKAIPCMNRTSVELNDHPSNCPFCDDSGIIYYQSKEIVGIFNGNSLEKVFETHGVWESGTALVTFPTIYPDGEQADFNTFDKLEVPDFTVRLWELKEYEPREKQLLRYPVQKVEFASSIVDGVQTIYQTGVDFNITPDGAIAWIPGKEPYFNEAQFKGTVVGFAYFAHPTYIVMQCLRELRITQELIDGQKTAIRLPQHVLVKRDYIVQNQEKLLENE